MASQCLQAGIPIPTKKNPEVPQLHKLCSWNRIRTQLAQSDLSTRRITVHVHVLYIECLDYKVLGVHVHVLFMTCTCICMNNTCTCTCSCSSTYAWTRSKSSWVMTWGRPLDIWSGIRIPWGTRVFRSSNCKGGTERGREGGRKGKREGDGEGGGKVKVGGERKRHRVVRRSPIMHLPMCSAAHVNSARYYSRLCHKINGWKDLRMVTDAHNPVYTIGFQKHEYTHTHTHYLKLHIHTYWVHGQIVSDSVYQWDYYAYMC